MNMLRAGAITISIWCTLNAVVALAVTALTLTGGSPPALAMTLSGEEIARVDPALLAVVRAQAALANPAVLAICTLVLALIWRWVVAGDRFALALCACVLLPLQIFGFLSDGFLGARNLAANLGSSALVVGGLALSALGQRQQAGAQAGFKADAQR